MRQKLSSKSLKRLFLNFILTDGDYMNENRVRCEIRRIVNRQKYIEKEYTDEIVDRIMESTKEIISEYETSALERCVKLIEEYCFNEKKIEKVGEYLTKEYHLFSKCPKLCYDTNDVVNYLKEVDKHEKVVPNLYWIFDEINDIYEQPLWIFGTGGNDEIHLATVKDFVDCFIIEALEEVGVIEGEEHHFENMIRIMEKN